MNDDLTPEEQAELERAKQDANAPIYAPVEWFEAAGQESSNGELHPFSSVRRIAYQRLGISSRSSIESGAGVVFLCLMPREEIDMARGSRWIDGKLVNTESAFREKMENWLDAIGFRFGEDVWQAKEIERIANEIWLREAASESVPKFPKGNGGKANPN